MRVSLPSRWGVAIASVIVLSSCGGSATNERALMAGEGSDPQAILDAARADLASDPDDSEAWFRYGLGWQRTEGASSADSAAAAFDRVLEIDPENVRALVHRGLAREDLRKFEEALADYTAASNLAPDDPLPYINLGSLLYFHYKKTFEAKEALTKALELDPKNPDAHFNLGVLFADANLFAEAKREWEKVQEFAPAGSPARNLADDNLERIRPLMEEAQPADGS